LDSDPLTVATVEVDQASAGERLDRFLAERLGVSRARVRHLLEFGRVSIDGGDGDGRALDLADKARRTAVGERFGVAGPLRADEERPMPRPDLDWRCVAEGPGWVGVDKPAGRGVHPLHPAQQETVLNAVVARHPEIIGVGEGGLRSGVVHRLDVDTTGALLFATTEEGWRRLRGAFSAHQVEKRYLALVQGRFEGPGRIELALAVKRHRPARVEVVEPAAGRLCRQRVRVLRRFEGATLVEVELETGFLHQIRASLAHFGHPVLGDREYGEAVAEGVRDEDSAQRAETAPRPMLHAARLVFEEIELVVPPPPDFVAATAALGEALGE
jgi:23S rRNA pseudouridine1911/1915/1917 synthase